MTWGATQNMPRTPILSNALRVSVYYKITSLQEWLPQRQLHQAKHNTAVSNWKYKDTACM